MLAVFWYTEKGIVGIAAALCDSRAENSGRFVDLDITHSDLWEQFETQFDTDNPYFYPRGRVVFELAANSFKVICDPKLSRSKTCKAAILKAFGLLPNTKLETDLHYRSEFESSIFAAYTNEELEDPFDI